MNNLKITNRNRLLQLTAVTMLMAWTIAAPPAPVAAAGKAPTRPALGYTDDNNDGKNDLFQDADGDGVNDVTGEEYEHGYGFADENGDGKNDLFLDADGDGVNDLGQNMEMNRERNMIVIDIDGDGINDITGKNYGSLVSGNGFIDEDGDGFNDLTPAGESQTRGLGRVKDSFIDEDGDGINDGRGFSRERRQRDIDPTGSHGNNGGQGGGNSGGNGSGRGARGQ